MNRLANPPQRARAKFPLKNTDIVRALPLSPHERTALKILNRDLEQRFPEIDLNAPRLRVPLVNAALVNVTNPYSLCCRVVRIARMVHNPDTHLIQSTINSAFGHIARMNKKPATKAA